MSDHHAVYCVRKSTLKLSPRFSTYCDMRNFNSDSFCRDLSQVPWSICEIFNDIDDCYYAWYTLFMEIANEHAPIRTKKCKKRQVPWMNLEIKELMRQRDLIRHTASKQKKEIYFKLYKCLRNHVTSELRKAKREYFYYLLSDKSPTPQTFWNNVKQLLPSNCQKTPALQINGQLTSDPTVVANAFNDYFVNVGPSLNQGLATEYQPLLATNASVGKIFSLQCVSVNTVFHYLQALHSKKAMGFDNIPALLIKEASRVIAPSIANIINHSIVSGEVPQQWKQARVIPVYKGNDATLMNNYRPISTLPVLSKILERIVHNQLLDYLELKNFLPPQQSGFRSGYSTASLLLKTTTNWTKAIDNGCYVGALFLDLRKAFDTVNHCIMLKQLADVGVNTQALLWFQNYLDGRVQSVRFQNKMSKPKLVTCGVPQGSILGRLLFSVYVRDLPKQACNCEINQFADDTAMHTASKSLPEIEDRLSNDFHCIAKWLSEQKLHLNSVKSKVILFGSRPALSQLPKLNIVFEGKLLQQVNYVQYLGVLLDSHLSWNDYLLQLRQKTSKTVKMLRRLSHMVPLETIDKL